MTNRFLSYVTEHGLTNYYHEKTWQILKINDLDKRISTEQNHRFVSMVDLKFVFIILIVGLMSSVFILGGEIFYAKYNKQRVN